MAEVSLEGLRFDRSEAVKSLDLRVLDREFLVLVGPSGCGPLKTLVRVTSRRWRPRGFSLRRF